MVLRIFCLAMVFCFTDITIKHKMTEKCKIRLQNVIKVSFLHIEKHQNHIEVDIESLDKLTSYVTLWAVDLQL